MHIENLGQTYNSRFFSLFVGIQFQKSQKVVLRTQKFDSGENAKFYADFKTVEKVAEEFVQKS
jgi:hypothetical protein